MRLARRPSWPSICRIESLAERQGGAIAAQRRLGGLLGRPEAIVGRRAAVLRGLGGILGYLGVLGNLLGQSWRRHGRPEASWEYLRPS